jgi:hypothetical protein
MVTIRNGTILQHDRHSSKGQDFYFDNKLDCCLINVEIFLNYIEMLMPWNKIIIFKPRLTDQYVVSTNREIMLLGH